MATYYVDTTQSANGDGSIGSPFNSWASVTWAAGNSYLGKAGTSCAETITPSASGTATSRITIGRYGLGANPIVGIGQARGVFLSARQFIDIVGIDAAYATSYGFHIRTNGSNIQSITLTDCNAFKNTVNGFYLDGQVLTAALTNVTFLRCYGWGNGAHGFDTLGIIGTVSWIYCKASGNGTLAAGHGFSLHPFISNNITSGWTLSSGSVYTRTLSASEDVQKVVNLTAGVTLTKNAGATTSVGVNEWDQSGITLYINTGGNPNSGTTMAWKRAAHGPFYYENCESWDNSTAGGAGEGHGFASDDMSSDSVYIGCFAWGNEGAGFQCQYTDRVKYWGCVADGNALSNFRTTGHTDTLQIFNSDSLNGAQHGIFVATPFTSVEVRNNIVAGNGISSSSYYGIIGGTTGITASNNDTYNNGSSGTNHTNNVTNTNGVTINPRLGSGYRPGNVSLIGAGTAVGGRDFYGTSFLSPPTIGAVEPVPSRSPVARSPVSRNVASRNVAIRRNVAGA